MNYTNIKSNISTVSSLFTKHRNSIVFVCLQIAVTGLVCSSYVLVNSLFILGFLAFAYICITANTKTQPSYRFFFGALACIVPALVFRSNSFLYLAAMAALCFSIEAHIKRLPTLAYLLLILISPISYYFFETFGFEIKLQITHAVVWLLHHFNSPIVADGNTILINGTRFSIDTACMGLRMTSYALCMTLFLHYYFLHNRNYPFLIDILIVIFALTLNIAANFSRILLLVIFRIFPDNPSHYIVGLLCFAFYSILPLLVVLPRIQKKYLTNNNSPNAVTYATPTQSETKTSSNTPKQCKQYTKYYFQSMLIVLLVASWIVIQKNYQQSIPTKALPKGFSKQTLANGTIQLSSQTALVYIKPIRSFLSSEHTPALCWAGSGYEISFINRGTTHKQQIFYGILSKHHHTLYTAWWIAYQNHKTIHQLEWRKAMLLQHSPSCLINITASSPTELQRTIDVFWQLDLQ